MNDHVTFVLLVAVIALGIAVIAIGVQGLFLRDRIQDLECELERRTQTVSLFEVARVCRSCGASDDVVIMAGCWWASADLCSSCDDDQATTPTDVRSSASAAEFYVPEHARARAREIWQVLKRLRGEES